MGSNFTEVLLYITIDSFLINAVTEFEIIKTMGATIFLYPSHVMVHVTIIRCPKYHIKQLFLPTYIT